MADNEDAIETNDGGTPLLDHDTAHVPEAREDIPPMQRIGMPLYDPELYEAPPDESGGPVEPAPESERADKVSDPRAHSEDVRKGKAGSGTPGGRGEGRV